MRLCWVFVVAISFAFTMPTPGKSQTPNTFVGELILKDVDSKGTEWELVNPFGYVDPQGTRWQADPGLRTDCASIPRALWSIIGAPCTGTYRRAAIIHDFYCRHHYRSWERVHRAFYDAMIAAGTSPNQAKIMYYAVWRWGPRWDVNALTPCIPNPSAGKFCAQSQIVSATVRETKADLADTQIPAIKAELAKLEKILDQGDVGLDKLSKMAGSHPRGRVTTRTFTVDELSRDLLRLENYKLSETKGGNPKPALPSKTR